MKSRVIHECSARSRVVSLLEHLHLVIIWLLYDQNQLSSSYRQRTSIEMQQLTCSYQDKWNAGKTNSFNQFQIIRYKCTDSEQLWHTCTQSHTSFGCLNLFMTCPVPQSIRHTVSPPQVATMPVSLAMHKQTRMHNFLDISYYKHYQSSCFLWDKFEMQICTNHHHWYTVDL